MAGATGDTEVDRMRVGGGARPGARARAWLAFRTIAWGAVAGAMGGGWFGAALARNDRSGVPGFAVGAALGIVAALLGHLIATASRPRVAGAGPDLRVTDVA